MDNLASVMSLLLVKDRTLTLAFFSCFPGINASKSAESKIYLLGIMVGAFNYVTEEKSSG